jgi:hypothetical protein
MTTIFDPCEEVESVGVFEGHYDLAGLKHLIDDVTSDEVSDKPENWCLAKYYLLLAVAVGGQLTDEVLNDSNMLYGNFMTALTLRLESFGWKINLGETPVKQ